MEKNLKLFNGVEMERHTLLIVHGKLTPYDTPEKGIFSEYYSEGCLQNFWPQIFEWKI